MGEPGLVHVGMLTAEADSRAAHRAKGKRHTRLAPGHIAAFSGVIDDLIHRHGPAVHHHDFGYGAHASYRGSARRADDRLLGDRRRPAAPGHIFGRHDRTSVVLGKWV